VNLPQTEAVDETTADLDRLDTGALVERLVSAQRDVADAVFAQRDAIAQVVEAIVARFARGGRLHYVGAGTSGRLAVLDAAEMPPTFGTEPELVHAHIAGGTVALLRAVEGAEDDGPAGVAAMDDVDADDAVIGLSASGGAAFVVGAIAAARSKGAFTACIVNSDASPLAAAAERAIVLRTGAEPVAGSTRMRAGSAQKIALNTISTAAMVLLGKVYGNLMVDVAATNEKLRSRARRLVERLTGTDASKAEALLEAAGGKVTVAVVMARRGCDATEAQAILTRHGGRLRDALE
jgi:N-acetylmuramic acid 6-phosphate etherase